MDRMKYHNLKAFQKHLMSAAPEHLCHLYLVAVAEDYERGQVVNAILSHLKAPCSRLSGAEQEVRDLIDAIGSMTLFGGAPVVVIDEVEKLGKKEAQTFGDHLRGGISYVILASRGKTPLMAVAEKEGVVLDLLEEKPWEKEKRLIDHIIERAKGVGKGLSLEGATLLLERVGPEMALLENEVEKLVCYIGEKGIIGREEILRITPASKSATLWQAAEGIVWEGEELPPLDSQAFHSLAAALRYQLHLGLSLATFIEEERPADEWSRYLPKLWPKMLEKRSSQAGRLGAAFFRKGIEKLFEIEMLSRSSSTHYRALLDLWRGYLHAR